MYEGDWDDVVVTKNPRLKEIDVSFQNLGNIGGSESQNISVDGSTDDAGGGGEPEVSTTSEPPEDCPPQDCESMAAYSLAGQPGENIAYLYFKNGVNSYTDGSFMLNFNKQPTHLPDNIIRNSDTLGPPQNTPCSSQDFDRAVHLSQGANRLHLYNAWSEIGATGLSTQGSPGTTDRYAGPIDFTLVGSVWLDFSSDYGALIAFQGQEFGFWNTGGFQTWQSGFRDGIGFDLSTQERFDWNGSVVNRQPEPKATSANMTGWWTVTHTVTGVIEPWPNQPIYDQIVWSAVDTFVAPDGTEYSLSSGGTTQATQPLSGYMRDDANSVESPYIRVVEPFKTITNNTVISAYKRGAATEADYTAMLVQFDFVDCTPGNLVCPPGEYPECQTQDCEAYRNYVTVTGTSDNLAAAFQTGDPADWSNNSFFPRRPEGTFHQVQGVDGAQPDLVAFGFNNYLFPWQYGNMNSQLQSWTNLVGCSVAAGNFPTFDEICPASELTNDAMALPAGVGLSEPAQFYLPYVQGFGERLSSNSFTYSALIGAQFASDSYIGDGSRYLNIGVWARTSIRTYNNIAGVGQPVELSFQSLATENAVTEVQLKGDGKIFVENQDTGQTWMDPAEVLASGTRTATLLISVKDYKYEFGVSEGTGFVFGSGFASATITVNGKSFKVSRSMGTGTLSGSYGWSLWKTQGDIGGNGEPIHCYAFGSGISPNCFALSTEPDAFQAFEVSLRDYTPPDYCQRIIE